MAAWNLEANDIFLKALEIPAPEERQAYLGEACGDDADLRSQVDALLAASAKAGSFLESPAPVPVATVDEPLSERLGTIIGPYKLLQQIGEGGMGTVWMAEQTQPVQRKVALKVIKPGMDSRQVVARFEAERQALAVMDHPNIARILDGGETTIGRPYFVMELVKGVPITDFCDQNHLTPRQRLELLIPVCQAVQHAHQKGIIHRDLKPSNVLVSRHDVTPVVKVIDFGVAKALGQELTDKTLFTGLAQMIGTPLYMSPEQAGMSDLDVDTRSDIYSLGVLLYELLTGTTPFTKERFKQAAYDEIRRIIREEEPPKPSTRLSESKDRLPSISAQRQTEPAKLTKLVRGELDWIVMKALEKDRNRRYETANGFAMDLQRYLADEPVLACPPSVGYRLRKFVRRNKSKVAFAGAVLFFLIVLGGVVGYTISERVSRQARVTTQVELTLDEVDRLMQEQKWPEALAAAQRAQATLVGGEGDDTTHARVRQVLADLELVRRLEEARLLESQHDIARGGWNIAGAEEAYAGAFADAGFTIEGVTVREAADQLRPRSRIVTELAAALTDWARLKTMRKRSGDSSWQHLLSVADEIDPDPWRRRLRAACKRDLDAKAVRELADSADVRTLPPSTVILLGRMLRDRISFEEGAKLLHKAQEYRPNDFWINFDLAGCLQHSDAGGGFYHAARALRPENSAVLINLGNVLRKKGEHDEAIRHYRKAIELDPNNALGHLNLGASLKQHRATLDEAIACYRRAIQLAPRWGMPHYNLGLALQSERRLDEAIAQYKRAIELAPKYAPAYSALGLALQVEGNLEEAVASCQKAIELDPKETRFHNNLGVALHYQGKLAEAMACYRKAIELDSQNAPAHTNLGNVLRDQGELDEAIACYRKAIELDPKYAPSHTNLGTVLSDQGKLDEAIAADRRAIELNPNDAISHSNLARTLFAQKKLTEAIASLRKAIQLEPKNAERHFDLGVVLEQTGEIHEAIACYRTAIELDPKYVAAHNNLGVALVRQKKLDEAIACYRKAIELDPKDAKAHNNLGVALVEQKKLDEAIACYRKAIELDPKYAVPHRNLGVALDTQGKRDEAMPCYRKAIELDPKDANAHNNLAWLLATMPDARLRNPKEAVELARRAVKLDPNSWHNWNTLSVSAYRAGQWDESLQARQEAIQHNDKGGPMCWNGLGMAMIRWQLGQKEEARNAYERVAEEAKKHSWLDSFRREAEELLGIPPAKPAVDKGKN